MQQQQLRNAQSSTSLARVRPTRQDEGDVFNGYQNRDFCNSFWGPGDIGPNVLFTRMRGAARTTDELRNFWHERTNIEEEYAQKLAKLAKVPIGIDEVGEFKASLDIMRQETGNQAAEHLVLSQRMRESLEKPTADFHMRQINHRRTIQANLEKKFKAKQTQETFAARAKEKYEGDLVRIKSYTQQMTYTTGRDAERLDTRMRRTKETAAANEKDFAAFTQQVLELLVDWENEWKIFCDSCQDLEEDRMEFMKDNMWVYANEVSSLCVSDDQSCERIREALDQFEPERDVLSFADEYGAGNELPQPPTVDDPNDPSPAPTARYAEYTRKSHRIPREYAVDAPSGSHHHAVEQAPTQQANPPLENGRHELASHPPPVVVPTSPEPSGFVRRQSTRLPLPEAPAGSANSEEQASTGEAGNQRRVLFYVRALYDYTATIEEEFDFQAGDIIAVTSAPEDGWWSGELLDEDRRIEGKHVFPSNFVCLF